ncbi:MAG TPA: hypothetical protein PLE85_08260 [Bacteroidales bacterium]|nr:hypothetical protein [Bacteroidales bacterium]
MVYRKRKHNRISPRRQTWDYRWNGAYFITICTKDRERHFGRVIDGHMQLSPLGVIADILWYEIKNHVNDVGLDAFVVMPDHIHGILILRGGPSPETGTGHAPETGTGHAPETGTGHAPETGTGHALSLFPDRSIGKKRFQNIGKRSVSSIIGSYKSAVTKHAHRLGFDFAWQTRFHDRIIRDDASFAQIQAYIRNNPAKWDKG